MNIVNLFQPIHSNTTKIPVVVKVVVASPSNMIVGGVPAQSHKVEDYVLLNALPEELRKRVELAVQALSSGQ